MFFEENTTDSRCYLLHYLLFYVMRVCHKSMTHPLYLFCITLVTTNDECLH